MIGHALGSFLIGLAAGRAAAPFVEHTVHIEGLHDDNPNLLTRAMEKSHRLHHDEYSGKRYFEDENNKNAVSRFSRTDVVTILGVTGIVGASANGAYAAATEMNPQDYFFTAGLVTYMAWAYANYEFLHWLMHKLDEPRKKMNLSLGDIVQPDGADGKLEVSHPLINQMYEEVHYNTKQAMRSKDHKPTYTQSLEAKLDSQLQANKKYLQRDVSAHAVLVQLTDIAAKEETEARAQLGMFGRAWRSVKQYASDCIRTSKKFKKLDYHHKVHHVHRKKNLGVAYIEADYVMRTKVDSSPEVLDKEKQYWVCPNPPLKKREYAEAAR